MIDLNGNNISLMLAKKKESSNLTKMSYYNQKESVMVLYANNKDTYYIVHIQRIC